MTTTRTRRHIGPGRRRKRLLSRSSLHQQVAEHLRDMIVHDDLPPGEKVPVAALATRLGVSLTPLREALKVLAEEQLVELTPNRGARVLAFTAEEATELFEVIAVLEALAAEQAATGMTEAQREELESLHAKMREHFERREKDAYFALNNRIHELIVRNSGNEVLIGTHAKLLVRARRGRYLAIIDPDRWQEAMQEHEAVMAAFRARDAARAMAVWRVHLQRSGEVVSEVLRRQHEQETGSDPQPAPAG